MCETNNYQTKLTGKDKEFLLFLSSLSGTTADELLSDKYNNTLYR